METHELYFTINFIGYRSRQSVMLIQYIEIISKGQIMAVILYLNSIL